MNQGTTYVVQNVIVVMFIISVTVYAAKRYSALLMNLLGIEPPEVKERCPMCKGRGNMPVFGDDGRHVGVYARCTSCEGIPLEILEVTTDPMLTYKPE